MTYGPIVMSHRQPRAIPGLLLPQRGSRAAGLLISAGLVHLRVMFPGAIGDETPLSERQARLMASTAFAHAGVESRKKLGAGRNIQAQRGVDMGLPLAEIMVAQHRSALGALSVYKMSRGPDAHDGWRCARSTRVLRSAH